MKYIPIALLFLLTLPAHALAQVPGPPPPDKYFAIVRYRILTLRDKHVAQYDALIEHLKGLKFEFLPPLAEHPDTDREDRTKNILTGLVPSANALKILGNRDVVNLMLIPKNFAPPAEPDKHVHVRLELNSALSVEGQFQLLQQVRLQLGLIGFREAPGYDQRGYSGRPFTRIVGVIPAAQLTVLLSDLRLQPTNWFDIQVKVDDLPGPLRSVNPIVVTEVLPDPNPLKALTLVPARFPPHLEKISDELWELVQANEPGIFRIQLVFMGSPSPLDEELQFSIRQAAPSMIIEGWLGQFLTGTVFLDDVPRLAAIPEVTAVRLGRYRAVSVDPKTKIAGNNKKALELSGLAELHKRGFRGKGVRLAIIDTDFRGWDKLVKEKKLPKSTLHVDLSSVPDDPRQSTPIDGDPNEIGHGSHCALAAHLAAPEADLVLVRISGVDPYQFVEAAQYIRGGYSSEAMKRRRDLLLISQNFLSDRRDVLLKERPEIIKRFVDERELEQEFGFLGPVMDWIFSERRLHFRQMEFQDRLEKELAQQYLRFIKAAEDLEKLKGITLVASSINWQDGYPVGGSSPISRWLHLQDRRKLLWFQSAGNNRGQAWTGPFRDVDKNGVMEFADLKTPLKKGRWTHELNFVGWQPNSGPLEADLPAQARVRISMQWREPHDPDYYIRPGEKDYYLKPLADLKLHVFKQRDASLKVLPADCFEAVGVSRKLPVRLQHLPKETIYEHSVEFTAANKAPFAVQIERQLNNQWVLKTNPFDNLPRFELLTNLVPPTMRPLGVPILPKLERNWDLHVRLFIEVLDDDTRPLGRPVFVDHVTEEGSMGMPADSLGAFTIGAVDLDDRPFAASTLGPPAFASLGGKLPDLWAYAALDLLPAGSNPAYGANLATPFAAGLAASMLSKCRNQEMVADLLRHQACKIVQVPPLR